MELGIACPETLPVLGLGPRERLVGHGVDDRQLFFRGTFGSQLGEVPVSGTTEGKALKLTMVAQTPNGDMTVTMTGDLDGDNIVNGKAEVAGLGQMEWSAKRIKQ